MAYPMPMQTDRIFAFFVKKQTILVRNGLFGPCAVTNETLVFPPGGLERAREFPSESLGRVVRFRVG